MCYATCPQYIDDEWNKVDYRIVYSVETDAVKARCGLNQEYYPSKLRHLLLRHVCHWSAAAARGSGERSESDLCKTCVYFVSTSVKA